MSSLASVKSVLHAATNLAHRSPLFNSLQRQPQGPQQVGLQDPQPASLQSAFLKFTLWYYQTAGSYFELIQASGLCLC